MSDMKCPFCQQELDYLAEDIYGCDIYGCAYCQNCKKHDLFGNEEMWQELIHTRKALGVSVDMLKIMKDGLPNGNRWKWEIDKALEQITALKQKDVK